MGGGGRLGSTLSLVEGRGLTGSPLRSGMTAVPQHYGSTLPRQSQPLAYGADPYGLYQRSALPRPDSLIGQSDFSPDWRTLSCWSSAVSQVSTEYQRAGQVQSPVSF